MRQLRHKKKRRRNQKRPSQWSNPHHYLVQKLASLLLLELVCSEANQLLVVQVYSALRYLSKPVQTKSLVYLAHQTRQRHRQAQAVARMIAPNRNLYLGTQRLNQVGGCLGQGLRRARLAEVYSARSHPRLVIYLVQQRRLAQAQVAVFLVLPTLAPRCSASVLVQASQLLELHLLPAKIMVRMVAMMMKLRMRVKNHRPFMQATLPKSSSRALQPLKPSNQILTRSCSR